MDRIKIPLFNGFSLVAERNADPTYNREIFIGLVDDSGVWYQDLAIVRNAYGYDGGWNVLWEENLYEVLVYSDKDNEDFTHDFTIGLHKEEPYD